MQSWLTTYDTACDTIDAHYAFRSKIINAFFEKCEEARELRRQLDYATTELKQSRRWVDYYRSETERIKKEYGFYRTI